jgi:hypothetical protein
MKTTAYGPAGIVAAALMLSPPLHAQSLVNLGQVGVGHISPNQLDQLGRDSLCGFFSGMALDSSSVTQVGNTYFATIYGVPDRGAGDGTNQFIPRLHTFSFAITPYYGPGPAARDQIVFSNTATRLFMVGGTNFTGDLPDDTNNPAYPKSLPSSTGLGLWSIDPEGLALAPDGDFYVCDEYGPFVYRFNSQAELVNPATDVLGIPEAIRPRIGPAFPRGVNYYLAMTPTNDSGRFENRGMEGVCITPDGKKVVAVLQSPAVQDGQHRNNSRNTRILVYDIDPASPTANQLVGEYVYFLTLMGARATGLSDVLALNHHQFLVVERDSRGQGSGSTDPILYKRIVLADISQASNLLGTGYDLEKGAPGQLSLPRTSLPAGIVPAARTDLVDLLDPEELAKYGFNTQTNADANTITEKWEGMAILPLNDPNAPRDFLLLVGSDNDFFAREVYHNGVLIGTNELTLDTYIFAYRIGEDHLAPTVVCPGAVTVAAATNCTLPNVASHVTARDNSAPPVQIIQQPPVGTPVTLDVPLVVTVTCTDAAGNRSEPCSFMVTVTDQTPPLLRCSSNLVVDCVGPDGAVVTFTATATDNCDANVSVACVPPSGSTFAIGTNTVACAALDASGNRGTCGFKVTVRPSRLTIERAVIVNWTCAGALQGADHLDGPWTDVPGATSPYCVGASQARRFYRVRN